MCVRTKRAIYGTLCIEVRAYLNHRKLSPYRAWEVHSPGVREWPTWSHFWQCSAAAEEGGTDIKSVLLSHSAWLLLYYGKLGILQMERVFCNGTSTSVKIIIITTQKMFWECLLNFFSLEVLNFLQKNRKFWKQGTSIIFFRKFLWRFQWVFVLVSSWTL